MFKDWIINIFNLGMPENGDDDIDINIAKANYQQYQEDLKQQQKEYIKTLCNQIKAYSRGGWEYVDTYELSSRLNTPEFRAEMKEYFEQRGFVVQEKSANYGVLETWLQIRWD